ncbi:probable histone-lysine N-methyltransferase CG1716 isoform X2 [Copidosoma floridanum]|uniref:probable histone-lysine N-methyltransferase CG1716 isoform X2 n=1 Tax=Copidosoma floridanum TaxID=29053 RepID=UPI0006C9693E|nr:probable histone-lysine N-methyltransferase CG1716 isoform X2 [Copidosoma floridanum]
MARPRKTEAKASEKEKPTPPPAVRKSNRQRTKKQLKELKLNGDIASPVVNNSEDSKQSADSDNSQEPSKKNVVPKKVGRRKKTVVEKEKSTTESASDQGENSVDQSDLNVNVLNVEKQMEISDNIVNEVVWSEDVIEETIICEEMEVDAEVTDSTCITQDENVVLEEVLLMNDPNFDDKDIVEYTLIETEDIDQPLNVVPRETIESVTSINENYKNTSDCETIEQIEQSVASLLMTDNTESVKEPKSVIDISHRESYRSLRSSSRGKGKPQESINQATPDSSVKKRTDRTSKKVASDSDGREKTVRRKKNSSAVSANTVEANNTQSSVLPLPNVVALLQEDDTSSSMSERAESQDVSDASTTDSFKDKLVNNSQTVEEKNICNSLDTKVTLEASKNAVLGSEEHSRDSEMDAKADSEDVKVSSSSENSNDTFLSSGSFKNSDPNLDNKNLFNKLNEGDKKSGFRSRSGSTDTTESETSSSGVRRSNRIRTIGLMKPRSRGRGLVTKTSIESSKISIQREEQDKLLNNVQATLEKGQNKNGSDNSSETSQSDKENSSNKTTAPQDVLTPLPSINNATAGYDSDSNKPVKVKSRWRRSSELEMSNSEAWAVNQPNANIPNSLGIQGFSTGISANSFNDFKSQSIGVGSQQETRTESQDVVVVPSHSSNTTSTLKSIGAKIHLPMISANADREMEERLSQFEHLKENLYLTERYTNKETKRMLCDCFLTEEEFERGELACGEDCLNRLLMIECGPRCLVGDRCTNKRFQNSEYADCEVFRTEKKGFGLRARTSLDAGDFIMEYVGEVVNPKDFRKRAKEYSKDKNRHYYFMALKSDQIIDATMKGNVSRFINHSCDPNAETQKWTVNGELRIGFFIKKFVAAGEEITFDYHFQRYGKEAQKCFCEAANCRGWIGDNPEDNKEKSEFMDDLEDDDDDTEDEDEEEEDEEEDGGEEEKAQEENKEDNKEIKEKKPRKQVRRKKTEKKVSDHMEDEDLEEQIEKLCRTGLKNRTHTLTLSRLMVRSREIQHRTRLLKVIQSGDHPCRRLFLDYHGLRLIWSYMMDVIGSDTDVVQQFRLEILKTLSTLPIPNKTMLIDSKVLSIIEKWSKQHYHSPVSGNSPDDDQSKLKSSSSDEPTTSPMEIDSKDEIQSEITSNSNANDIKKPVEIKSDIKGEINEYSIISELASNLLADWSNLKEVFRIPKKERIEQMKEHEREADRGYKEKVEKEVRDGTFFDRYRTDRYSSRSDSDKRLRRGRDSPDFEHGRSKDKRGLDERPNLVPMPRMTKYERRQLFALKVAKEEEERQRRQHEDLWQQHEAQCLALGLDPNTTAAYDPQTGYPLFFNQQLGQWQAIPCQVPEGATPETIATMFAAAGGSEIVYPPGYDPATAAVPLQMQNGPTTASVTQQQQPVQPEFEQPSFDSLPPPPLDLPPKWKWARDKKGRLYYFHVKDRVSQWLPPPPDHIAVQPDSSDTSESSDETSSSNDEEEEVEPQLGTPEQQLVELMEADEIKVEQCVPPEPKKRRDGLVQERIISPRREEDRVDHKKYKEIKEKLRRHKERAKIKEQVEKMKKMRRSSKSKSYSKHSTITSDMSPTTERKIKDAFRISMAEVMVHFLNPYRKNDCKQGRITNTEDFKHLARKLTHFVLAKELKHCKSVDELECNDNVKHKAKDFVRKYMSKFGAVYQKTDED